MEIKTFDFIGMKLNAIMHISTVWFNMYDTVRILNEFSGTSTLAVAKPEDDEQYVTKGDEVRYINDSALFRKIDALSDCADTEKARESLQVFRRFITHSAIPTMYRDFYSVNQVQTDDSDDSDKETPDDDIFRYGAMLYNETEIRYIIENNVFWFVISDIRKATNLNTQTTQLTSYADASEIKKVYMRTSGGPQNLLCATFLGLTQIVNRGYKKEPKEFLKCLEYWLDGYDTARYGNEIMTNARPVEERQSEVPDAVTETTCDTVIIDDLKSEISELRKMIESNRDLAESTCISVESILRSNPLPVTVLLSDDCTTPDRLAPHYNMTQSAFLETIYKLNINIDADKTYYKFSYETVINIYNELAKIGVYPKY